VERFFNLMKSVVRNFRLVRRAVPADAGVFMAGFGNMQSLNEGKLQKIKILRFSGVLNWCSMGGRSQLRVKLSFLRSLFYLSTDHEKTSFLFDRHFSNDDACGLFC